MNDAESQKVQRAFFLRENDDDARSVRWLIVLSANPWWCDFGIYEATGWEVHDNSPLFLVRGWRSSDQVTAWSNDCEPIMTGHVKWDGCSEFRASAHFCDAANAYSVFGEVIQITMAKARELMSDRSVALKKEPYFDWELPYTQYPILFDAVPYELPERWLAEYERPKT